MAPVSRIQEPETTPPDVQSQATVAYTFKAVGRARETRGTPHRPRQPDRDTRTSARRGAQGRIRSASETQAERSGVAGGRAGALGGQTTRDVRGLLQRLRWHTQRQIDDGCSMHTLRRHLHDVRPSCQDTFRICIGTGERELHASFVWRCTLRRIRRNARRHWQISHNSPPRTYMLQWRCHSLSTKFWRIESRVQWIRA